MALCKVIRIPDSGKFLLVESGIRDIFACEIWNPELCNLEFIKRNPESGQRLESSVSEF